MLRNSNVAKVSINSETGLCKIYMENGEIYQNDDIYFPEDFLEYYYMLRDEDNMTFKPNSIWILFTQDDWTEWEESYRSIGVSQVLFCTSGKPVEEIALT